LRELHQRFAEEEVVLIGVHTPEFEREKDIEAVRSELGRQDLRYPIAIDNDWRIWKAFENHYWPALYLIDKQGRVRAHHRGELHQGTPAWDDWLAQIEDLRAEG
jgi:alkyl hydroperoxide reductase subunit AhpC